MRILLLALAVIDDLGAIIVIALFYSSGIHLSGLVVAAVGLTLIIIFQKLGVRRPWAYLFPGWWCGGELGAREFVDRATATVDDVRAIGIDADQGQLVARLGFTMALFVGTLAFAPGTQLEAAKLGILCASATAGVLGLTGGRFLLSGAPARKEPQVGHGETGDDGGLRKERTQEAGLWKRQGHARAIVGYAARLDADLTLELVVLGCPDADRDAGACSQRHRIQGTTHRPGSLPAGLSLQ